MTTFAIVNSNGNIVELGTREEMDAAGWGHNRELVELVADHVYGDRIDYNEKGVEVLWNLEKSLVDDAKGFAEDDNGTAIDWDGGVEIVSGEGAGEGAIELYEGEETAAALRERLEDERAGGDRWAFARPAGSTAHEERYTFSS
jgi:hypothetical protein